MSYYEKLKDPRWQKRRLEILEQREWSCQLCESETNTLNVHHGFYMRGMDPWGYEDETMWVLCEECHKKVQDALDVIHEATGRIHPTKIVEIAEMISMEQMDLSYVLTCCIAVERCCPSDVLVGSFMETDDAAGDYPVLYIHMCEAAEHQEKLKNVSVA